MRQMTALNYNKKKFPWMFYNFQAFIKSYKINFIHKTVDKKVFFHDLA